jgi:hypothetical protein
MSLGAAPVARSRDQGACADVTQGDEASACGQFPLTANGQILLAAHPYGS